MFGHLYRFDDRASLSENLRFDIGLELCESVPLWANRIALQIIKLLA
jgi:hypothetical protein